MKLLMITTFLLVFTFANSQDIQILDTYGNPIKRKKESSSCVKGEVIVKFKKGYLNKNYISNSQENKFVLKNAFSNKNVQTSFSNVYKNFKARKVVSKFKAEYAASKSRLNKQIKVYDFENLLVLDVYENDDIHELCLLLKNYDEIEYASPNYLVSLDDNPPNDLLYINQDGFESVTDNDIDANRAWDFTTGNEGIKVGIKS